MSKESRTPEGVRKYLGARLNKQGKEIRDLRLAVESMTALDQMLRQTGDVNYRLVHMSERITAAMERPWWQRLLGKK